MTAIERFDPFNNRLCRDVRNALSEAFATALEHMDMQPVRKVADAFRDDPLTGTVKAYIDRRLSAYEQVLTEIRRHPLEDPLEVAFRIWDRGLFFETHEYLEPFWMQASGERRALLQAVIRAAGAYVHLEQGNRRGADRIAAKAIDALERFHEQLSATIDPQLLLDKLRRLDPVPPKLSGTSRASGANRSKKSD